LNRSARRLQQQARARLGAGEASSPWLDHPSGEWEKIPIQPPGLFRVASNSRFLALLAWHPSAQPDGAVLLLMLMRKDTKDGITWDELWNAKNALGFADHEAVELYPRVADLVNVANIRHLWVFPAGRLMPFGLDRARAAGRR